MQLPKQLIKFLVQRSQNEGVKFEAISLDELIELADMETEYDEPVIERYREEIAEYIAKHPEEFKDKDSTQDVASAGDDSSNSSSDDSDLDPTPTDTEDGEANLDNADDTEAVDDVDNNEANVDNNNSNVANNGNNANNNKKNTAKATPTPTPSQAELIEQYYKEILSKPDLYKHLLPTPTPEPVQVASSDEELEVVPEYVPEEPKKEENNSSSSSDSGSDGGTPPSGDPPSGGGGGAGDGNSTGVTYSRADLDGNSKVPKYTNPAGGDPVFIGYSTNDIKLYCELNGIDVQVVKGGTSAYFRPANNSITLPDISQYKNPYEYFSTVFHELSHAIDHKLHLSTGINEKVKIDNYSAGELLAEISAAMMCQQYDIPDTETFENSVSYIDGWSKKIKDERASFIVSVASKSWQAVEELVSSVEKEIARHEAEQCNEIAVQAREGIINVFVNSDGDFEYNIYKQDSSTGKIKLYDGGILDYSEDGIKNVFDALTDILDGLGIEKENITPVDMDDLESVLDGDMEYDEVFR